MQTIFHYFMHFGVVGFFAFLIDKKNFFKIWLLLISTMIVDIDHLWANPVFDPNRCSIGYHLFHSPIALIFYVLGLFMKNKYVKIFSFGLLFHMLTDTIDCFWTFSHCSPCKEQSIFNNVYFN